MCGIAGIVYKDGALASPESDTLKVMLSALKHRGPDDEGVFYRNNVALGHRRLAILDVSEAGHQPMHYKDYVIVYNGEVYNYIEIREELEALGHRFLTGTDTEVVLHAYEQWKEACLERFNGMWAFVLYDRSANRLFCSRDRFGIKPLYYYEDEKVFIFASEIKAILAAGVKAKADMSVLLTYLVVGFLNFSKNTFFSGIGQLLPGRNLLFDLETGTALIERYYDLATRVRAAETGTDYADCLKDSVRLHLRSDVAVGTCLSGGLDSSVVAALAASLFKTDDCQRDFGAVTAVSESKANDESEYARSVADHCGLEWLPVKPTYRDFSEHIDDCLFAQGEPVGGPSLFMQYWVLKCAKEAGYKVMLDGQGGDESLLGYERYYPGFFYDLFKQGSLFRMISEYKRAADNSKLSLVSLMLYSAYFMLLPVRKRILKKRVPFLDRALVDDVMDVLNAPSRAFFNIRALQLLEISTYQLPNLLLYEDRNSMAHSIEARVPFVEVNCIEAAVSLDPKKKIRDGFTKYPLRLLAERILPDSIAWRTNKIGFEAPTKLWLDQHNTHMQAIVDESQLLKKVCRTVPKLCMLNLDIRWKLYNIAVWEKQYCVSAD